MPRIASPSAINPLSMLLRVDASIQATSDHVSDSHLLAMDAAREVFPLPARPTSTQREPRCDDGELKIVSCRVVPLLVGSRSIQCFNVAGRLPQTSLVKFAGCLVELIFRTSALSEFSPAMTAWFCAQVVSCPSRMVLSRLSKRSCVLCSKRAICAFKAEKQCNRLVRATRSKLADHGARVRNSSATQSRILPYRAAISP